MGDELIKSFLVGLGFGVDDASLKKFNSAIASATVRVAALYGAVNAAAAGIVAGISDISDGFEKMGYEYHIIAPAINKALVLRRELLHAYSAAGINITKVIQASVKLNMSLAKTKFAFEAIYKSVGSRFFGLLTKQSDLFRQKIYANMPKIQLALEQFVKFIFKAFEGVTTLGVRLWGILSRVYDFFVSLDKATDGWSTIILGVLAAWKLLNLSFLATPLGMIIAGFVTLLALWDDFKTYKEGGISLIDWGSDSVRAIVGVVAAVAALAAGVYGVILALRAWAAAQALVNLVMSLNPIGLMIAGITILLGLLTALAVKLGFLKGVGQFFSDAGQGIMDLIGGPNTGANLQSNPGGPRVANPVGGVQNSSSNQNVAQQTNINVIGSADAQSTGKAVAGEQGKVNFDLVRNLKGATR